MYYTKGLINKHLAKPSETPVKKTFKKNEILTHRLVYS
jgi:hypothetical protein